MSEKTQRMPILMGPLLTDAECIARIRRRVERTRDAYERAEFELSAMETPNHWQQEQVRFNETWAARHEIPETYTPSKPLTRGLLKELKALKGRD